MRILSLNAWGGRLHEPLMDYIAAVDADVLCLQEVTRTHASGFGWLAYRDGDLVLPQRANLFAEIRATLPGHQAFFHPASRGFLNGDDGRSHASEFGLATFVRDSLPVIGQVAGFIHGRFSADGWGDHPRPRNAHGVRLYDEAARAPITVVQLHGLRDPAGKHDTPARLRQAEALSDLVARTRGSPDERLVVCGDFNVLPDSATFRVLGELGLRDLVTAGGHTDTRTSHYTKAGRFADYMLVNAAVDVEAFEVVADPEVSDHRPLLLAAR
ncbi:endonuclease/exonuclease/phosphatase family protein [Chthonobacter albigriseus]|uniref:endonuclease/exonuclease/phosphatase family protein n=1 Tax=Chthonobacter albigriseus TaxID=1683161 RepID=UPI0015EEF4C5|nr:endonuclease/exonuclease/phosphatase family protein [Chthonobacter albigriseus]